MEVQDLPPRGRITVDSAAIIYVLEDHPEFASRYAPLFEGAESGDYELVISAVTLLEVLTGPLRTGDEELADRYRRTLTTGPAWRVVEVDADVAHRAARIRARSRLRLADAVQMATALESSSIALVTHDRDLTGDALASLSEGVSVYH